jgi:hypothetical protein
MNNILKEELGPFYIEIPGLYKAFFKKVKAVIFKKYKKGDNLLYTKGG